MLRKIGILPETKLCASQVQIFVKSVLVCGAASREMECAVWLDKSGVAVGLLMGCRAGELSRCIALIQGSS